MDSINKKIIRALTSNARTSITELSKIVHLSAPAVKERIEKLEAQGIIQDYTLRTDMEALGYAISGFVHADILAGKEAEFKRTIQHCEAITECYNVTGERAFIFRIAVRTMSELDHLLEQLSPLCKTDTSLILSQSIAPRLPGSF
ncbi:MAG: Lrp/AsnC family transcriptional regulator [Pseudomonadales bacterium]